VEIGIIGLPQSGKSTLFEIMTGVRSREMHAETCVRGLATVPDARHDRLVEIFKPEKALPAKVPFSDVNAVGEKAWDAARASPAPTGFCMSSTPSPRRTSRKSSAATEASRTSWPWPI
jgi:hypothetical protein